MVSKIGTVRPNGLTDKLLWGVVFALLASGVVGNYYFADRSLLLRVVGLLIFLMMAVGVASRTTKGQSIWQNWVAAVSEVRKMVWPTRQETLQTTLAVLAMVLVMGLLLWTTDFVLIRVVGRLTGHWGA